MSPRRCWSCGTTIPAHEPYRLRVDATQATTYQCWTCFRREGMPELPRELYGHTRPRARVVYSLDTEEMR
jgi:hypothetical protein